MEPPLLISNKKNKAPLSTTKYSKSHPFASKILSRILLSKENSTKKTYHLTLDLTSSDIFYKPGDSIAIFPENPPEIVDKILKLLKKSGHEDIICPRSKKKISFHLFLTKKANLLRISPYLLKMTFNPTLLNDRFQQKTFIENHDLEDLFQQFPFHQIPLQDIVLHIAPLLPRFYSIASSQYITKNCVDFIVVTFNYIRGQKKRKGISSQFLCQYAKVHKTPVMIYHQSNPLFKLPKNPTSSIIMIGPGTGIAPFRAFLQERLYLKASGRHWLFFGERQRNCDFYYKNFLLDLEKNKKLRLDLAFSRDQKEKIYVQDKLKEHSLEIWQWIQTEAFIYICGDAHFMAKDVSKTLQEIIKIEGNFSEEEAKHFLKKLRREKRLLFDVY